MERGLGIVGSRQRQEILPERFGDRQQHCLVGFSGDETDLVLLQVDVLPGEERQVGESLRGIVAEFNQ